MSQERSEDQVQGTVMAIQANYYFVRTDSKELLCTCRTRLKKIGQKVMVGDRVKTVEPTGSDGRGSIIAILPRSNELSRPAIANVDHLLLLFAFTDPPLDPWQLSRFLVKAESSQINLTLCLNKADLVTEGERQQWCTKLREWGYQPIIVSVTTGMGLVKLQERLQQKTTILAGPSGVGKSTLTNALIPAVHQRVNTVSGKLHHGRHTTRHVELFPLPGDGFLADSPGFNQPDLDCHQSDVAQYFPEIRRLLAQNNCQFNDCLHHDEPNCAVGSDWERYEHYLKFLEEVIALESQKQHQADPESQLKLKIRSSGTEYYEPKLESKKYRRLSRREKHQTLTELSQEFEEES